MNNSDRQTVTINTYVQPFMMRRCGVFTELMLMRDIQEQIILFADKQMFNNKIAMILILIEIWRIMGVKSQDFYPYDAIER